MLSKMFPKHKPWRSKKYIKFVSSLPCCITGSNEVVAHHIINCNILSGTGTKVSDLFTIPLDARLHGILHNDPKAFELMYDQKKLALETIEKAVMDGVLN